MKKTLPRIAGLATFIIALTTMSALAPHHPVIAAECTAQKPAAPGGVWAKTGPGSGQVTISWDGVSDAKTYAVVYGTKSGSYIYGGDPIGESSSRQYTVNALNPGVQYFFRVIAKRDHCASPWSSEASATAGSHASAQSTPSMLVGEPASHTQAGLPAVSVAKAGPVGKQNVWAKSGPNTGEVTLYWQDADSANDYHLMYGTQAGAYTYGALNIGNIKSFTVQRLVPGTLYHFALVPLLNGRPLYTTPSVGVTAYITPSPAVVQPGNQAMELIPGFNEDGTLNQQSFSDDDADEYDDDDQYDDEDEDEDEDDDENEDYDDDDDEEEDDDEFDDQGYIMNQEDLSYSGSDDEEQVAEQYLMDPEEFRMGGPSYDPLFE